MPWRLKYLGLAATTRLPATQARGLAHAVHRALVDTCGVPENDLFQLITAYSTDRMIIDPHYPHFQRSADASIVEVLFLLGRTKAQKIRLFKAIADGAALAGFRADDIMVALTENSPSDWSAGGGVPFGA